MLFLSFTLPIIRQPTNFGYLRCLQLGREPKARRSKYRDVLLPVPDNLSGRHCKGLRTDLHLGLSTSNRLRINYSSAVDDEIYLILTCRPSLFGCSNGKGCISVPSTQSVHLLEIARSTDKWYDAILRAEPGDIFRVKVNDRNKSFCRYYIVSNDDVFVCDDDDYEDIYLAIQHEVHRHRQASRSPLVTADGTWRDIALFTPEPLVSTRLRL